MYDKAELSLFDYSHYRHLDKPFFSLGELLTTCYWQGSVEDALNKIDSENVMCLPGLKWYVSVEGVIELTHSSSNLRLNLFEYYTMPNADSLGVEIMLWDNFKKAFPYFKFVLHPSPEMGLPNIMGSYQGKDVVGIVFMKHHLDDYLMFCRKKAIRERFPDIELDVLHLYNASLDFDLIQYLRNVAFVLSKQINMSYEEFFQTHLRLEDVC
jgi:hypothetical protein